MVTRGPKKGLVPKYIGTMAYKDKRKKLETARRWAQEHPEQYRAIRERARKKYRQTNAHRELFGMAKLRAKYKELPFTITREWFDEKIDNGKCEVTGLDFVLEQNNPLSPSIDQRVPGLGYTPENTQVVVRIYNTAKNEWSHRDVLVLAEALMRQS